MNRADVPLSQPLLLQVKQVLEITMNYLLPAAMVAALSIMGCAIGLDAPSGADKEAVVKGNNKFGFDLYARLRTSEGNLFFSPYSISTALSMTYAGAKGETATEMAKVLQLPLPQDQLPPAVAAVIRDLASTSDGVRLAVANALWGQKGQPFVPAFLQTTRTWYGAGFHEINFGDATAAAKEINTWVEQQTQDKIKDLLSPDSVKGASLVLTNAIYFKGDWAAAFTKSMTRKQDFFVSPEKKVPAEMMHHSAKFGYLDTDDYQVLSMPYKGDSVSMIVLLPRQKNGLEALEAKLNAELVNQAVAKLKETNVMVGVPKFKMTTSFELADVLSKMGMPSAFQAGKADFTGIATTRDLYISGVVHKAYVDVNEEGTEAAAATAVVAMRASVVGPQPPIFHADHPFVFAIRDNKTGSLLFLGRVANPAG
jgi:serpin B